MSQIITKYTIVLFFFLVLINPLYPQIDTVLLSDKVQNENDTVKITLLKSICWKNRYSDVRLSLYAGINALELAQKHHLYAEIAGIHNYLGVVRRNIGDYSKALDHYYKALELAENYQIDIEKAYAMNNIGDIYNKEDKYKDAGKYILEALKMFEKIGDKRGIAYGCNQMGMVSNNIGNYEQALEYHQRALKIRREIDDKMGISASLNRIGNIYQEVGKHDEAFNYFLRSLEIQKETGDKMGISYSYLNIAHYYLAIGENNKAKEYYSRALQFGEEIKSPLRVKHAAGGLSRVFAKEKNYEKAYQYHLLHKQMDDSLKHEESRVKITQLDMQYNFDKQQAELKQKQAEKLRRNRIFTFSLVAGLIVILVFSFAIYRNYRIKKKANKMLANQKAAIQEKNEELQMQKEEITAQRNQIEQQRDKYQKLNSTKDKFFSIVAHDLRSPYNSLMNLTRQLLENIDQYSREQIKGFVQGINQSSKEAYNLLENLLHWARSQTNRIEISPQNIDVTEIIVDNIALLKNSAANKQISVENDIQARYIYADYNTINTVVRNLISNAIKFTPAEGSILVSSIRKNGRVKISVSDTGVGISEENQKKLFRIDTTHTTLGTMHEKGTGLGLILCKEFVEKNKGRIYVESKKGEGSIFSIELLRGKDIHAAKNSELLTDKDNEQTTEKRKVSINENEKTTVSEEIILLLEKDFYAEYESIQRKHSINEIKDFAKKLKAFGEENDIAPVSNYADELLNHVNSFDVEGINQMLTSYPKLISATKNRLK